MPEQEALSFSELMTAVPSVDSKDRSRSLDKTLQSEYETVMQKVNEYGQAGELNLKIKFTPQKDVKNGLSIEATVTTKLPKGKPKVNFYRGNNGVYLADPSQLSLMSKQTIVNINNESANQQKG